MDNDALVFLANSFSGDHASRGTPFKPILIPTEASESLALSPKEAVTRMYLF